MRLDQYSNPIFNEQDIFKALYKGQSLSPGIIADTSLEIHNLEEQLGFSFLTPYPDDFNIDLENYDSALQSDWFMPSEYKTLDIEEFLVSQCPEQHYQRLIDELTAYKERNMLDLLRWLKYFVDTCTNNNILWGLGRGSSLASYVLFLLGVHSVDSIKYNLDWREFLR